MEILILLLKPLHGVVNWLNDLDEGALANLILWATMFYALLRLESRHAALLTELRKARSADKE
jgi:hypothetical protein